MSAEIAQVQAESDVYAADLEARAARGLPLEALGRIPLRGHAELPVAAPPPLGLGAGAAGSADVPGGLGQAAALGFGEAPISNQELAKEVLAVKEVLAKLKIPERRSTSKKRKAKKGTRRRRRGSSSSSGSGSASSRSASRSSRGSEEARRRYPRWVPKGDRKVAFDSEMLTRSEVLHFRKRKDLLSFANRHPGALGAHFLLQVRRRLMRPLPENSSELRETDPTAWAMTQADLKEVRDLCEVQLLSRLLMDINSDRLASAVDLLVMRIREIRMAKAQGGTWEKAGAISLMPSSVPVSVALPDGAMSL